MRLQGDFLAAFLLYPVIVSLSAKNMVKVFLILQKSL